MGKKINDNSISKRSPIAGSDQFPVGVPGNATDYVATAAEVKSYVLGNIAAELTALQTLTATKSKTFTTLPANYAAGDLWIPFTDTTLDGTTFKAGKLYTATAGSVGFVTTHWQDKISYTDDTAANSKAAVYTAKPSSYNKGDLLIPFADFTEGGTTFKAGELYTAITSSAGPFNKDHWAKKVVYTDDTAANARGKTTIGDSYPANPRTGDIHFKTDLRKWYVWNGTSWSDAGLSGLQYLWTALDKSTEVNGGLVLSHLMGVRNGSGEVTAYLNGLSGSNGIALATGVTDFGTVDEKHVGEFYHNGNIVIKKNNDVKLQYNASTGVLELTGYITATGGSIGGFTLDSNKLYTDTPTYELQSLTLDTSATPTLKFYSGMITDNGLPYGNVIPDLTLTCSSSYLEGDTGLIRAITEGGKVTEVSGAGFFTNGSGTTGFPASSGVTNRFSIVGLLQKRDYDAYFPGIAAAIMGYDQTTSSDGNSRSYGGWFNTLYTNQLNIGPKIVSSYGTYFLTEKDGCVLASGSMANSYIMLHEGTTLGALIIVRNASDGSIYVNRTGSFNIIDNNSNSQTSITIGKGKTMMLYKGNTHYYVLFVN